jgi:hypothetical protein
LKINRTRKPLFAANYTDFREFGKNQRESAKSAARVFEFLARWQLELHIIIPQLSINGGARDCYWASAFRLGALFYLRLPPTNET